MSTKLTDTEMAAWQALLHAHHDLWRRLDAELQAEHGLSLSEYDVLLRLARAEGRRLHMTELARRVMISASALTRATDRLERDGLVRRERGKEDRRVVVAHLTTTGLATIRAASRTHVRGIREQFTGRLTEAQLLAVASALQVITGPHRPH